VREVRRENLGAEKGAGKSLGRGRGCVFVSSPKRLERPHPEQVHWWLLVHSNPVKALRENERGDETQFTTKIGGKTSLGPSYFVF